MMFSIARQNAQIDPVVRRKILQLRVFGIAGVLLLWLVVVASFLGYFPWRVGVWAAVAEILIGPFLIAKVRALRRSTGG